MARYRLELTLEGLPKPTNQMQRTHWTTQKAEKDLWVSQVRVKTVLQKPPKPLENARLTLTRHSAVCPDFDGLVSSFKYVMDGLVHAGVLKDDKMKYVNQPNYKWEKAPRGKGWVHVIVEEVTER